MEDRQTFAGSLAVSEDIVRALGLQQNHPSRRNNEMVRAVLVPRGSARRRGRLCWWRSPPVASCARRSPSARPQPPDGNGSAGRLDEELDDAV